MWLASMNIYDIYGWVLRIAILSTFAQGWHSRGFQDNSWSPDLLQDFLERKETKENDEV